MDISNIKPTERSVEIEHPGTGAYIGLRIHVMSIDDERLKPIKRSITDERFKLESKGKSLKTEDVERNGERLLFKATTGWEWYNPTGKEGDDGYDAEAMPNFNGSIPDHNQRNFVDLIRAVPWIGDQLREEIDETKAFFGNSKGN